MVGAYASFTLAILTVLVIAGWGAYVDFDESRRSLLQSEVQRIRSHAVRTVMRIQGTLPAEQAEAALAKVKDEAWLRDHWDKFTMLDPARTYSTVISPDGVILAHSNPLAEGGKLKPEWYSTTVQELGDDAVVTDDPVLTGGVRSIDVSIPIEVGQRDVGTYHSGYNMAYFEEELARRRVAVRSRWGLAFAFISIVIALAGASMFHVTRRISKLQSALAMGHVRRLADLGQLAGGIAHEVRNPLNAIRLNLHVIDRLLEAQAVADDRTHTMITESVREMDRVDGLLRMLLNYARPDKPRSENLDLTEELPAVADFIRPIIERDGVRLELSLPQQSGMVKMDRSRFRQIVINLLKNAAEASGPDGRIDASLRFVDQCVELSVRDHGAGVDPRVRDRIFEPFFTTKDVGTGLGLTLARRYVEEAGGDITVRSVEPHGAEFLIRLPRSNDRTPLTTAGEAAVPEYA